MERHDLGGVRGAEEEGELNTKVVLFPGPRMAAHLCNSPLPDAAQTHPALVPHPLASFIPI